MINITGDDMIMTSIVTTTGVTEIDDLNPEKTAVGANLGENSQRHLNVSSSEVSNGYPLYTL